MTRAAFAIACLLVVATTRARAASWVGNGPGTGSASLIAPDANSLVVYASDLASIVRSTDGGATWTATFGENNGSNQTQITAVEADRSTPGTVWADAIVGSCMQGPGCSGCSCFQVFFVVV